MRFQVILYVHKSNLFKMTELPKPPDQPMCWAVLCHGAQAEPYFANHSAAAWLSTAWCLLSASVGSSRFSLAYGCFGQWRFAWVNLLRQPSNRGKHWSEPGQPANTENVVSLVPKKSWDNEIWHSITWGRKKENLSMVLEVLEGKGKWLITSWPSWCQCIQPHRKVTHQHKS